MSFKNILGVSAIGVTLSLITLQSCTRDQCNDLVCKNGASCVNNNCECPTGYEGQECEIAAGTKFTGLFVGTTTIDSNEVNLPTNNDSVTVSFVTEPNSIKYKFAKSSLTTTDSFTGTANGYTTTFTDIDSTHFHQHANATVDNGLLNFYFEQGNDSTGVDKVYHFTGRLVN